MKANIACSTFVIKTTCQMLVLLTFSLNFAVLFPKSDT